MFRRILASLIIIPILLLLVYGYLQLRKSTANNKDALSVLPENAMVLMEWHGMDDLIEDIKNANDSSLQKHFLNQLYISSCFHFMETLKQNISNENGLVNAFKSNNVYTALYQSSNKSYNWFFCTTIPKEIDERVLLNIIKNIAKTKTEPKQSGETYELEIDAKNKLYFYLLNGIFAASQNQLLLKSSWLQLNDEKKKKTNTELDELTKLSNTNNAVSIYVNSKRISKFLGNYFKSETDFLGYNGNFDKWISADVELNNSYVFANGFITNDAKSINKLSKPSSFEMVKIIPSNMASIDWYNDASFNNKSFIQVSDSGNTVKLNCFDNEFALLTGTSLHENIDTYKFKIIELKENVSFKKYIQNVDSSLVVKQFDDSVFTISNKKFSSLFNEKYINGNQTFCAQLQQYIVFANSYTALKKYIQQIELKNTLVNNIDYKFCADKLFSNANQISIYFPDKYSSYLFQNLSDNGKKFYASNENWLKKISFVCNAVSNNGKQMQRNIYVNFKYNPKLELNKAWQHNFEDAIELQPIKLHSKEDSCDYIAVHRNSKIEILNTSGKSIKSIALVDTLLGDIASVKSKKSKNEYCLFNTKTKLYVYNAHGEMQKGFPVSLKEKTNNSSTVFYTSENEARIMIACNDNRIYLFDIKGKAIEDWKNPKIKNQLQLPIIKTNNQEKPFYCGFDVDGNYFCFDAKGKKANKKDSIQLQILNIEKCCAVGNQSAVALAKGIVHIIDTKKGTSTESINIGTMVYDMAVDKNDINLLLLLTNRGIAQFDIHNKKTTWLINNKCNKGKINLIQIAKHDYLYYRDEVLNKLFLFDTKNNSLQNGFPINSSGKPLIINSDDEFGNYLLIHSNQKSLQSIYINEK